MTMSGLLRWKRAAELEPGDAVRIFNTGGPTVPPRLEILIVTAVHRSTEPDGRALTVSIEWANGAPTILPVGVVVDVLDGFLAPET